MHYYQKGSSSSGFFLLQLFTNRGHSTTTWTKFHPILSIYSLHPSSGHFTQYSSVLNCSKYLSIQDGNFLRNLLAYRPDFKHTGQNFFSKLIKHTGRKSLFTGFFVRFLRFYKKNVPKKNTDRIFY